MWKSCEKILHFIMHVKSHGGSCDVYTLRNFLFSFLLVNLSVGVCDLWKNTFINTSLQPSQPLWVLQVWNVVATCQIRLEILVGPYVWKSIKHDTFHVLLEGFASSSLFLFTGTFPDNLLNLNHQTFDD